MKTLSSSKFLHSILLFWLNHQSSKTRFIWHCTLIIQIGPMKTAPLLISTIEIRVLWMVTKHHKSAARILDRDCINRGGLDLSKEVLWVSVCISKGSRSTSCQSWRSKKKICRAARFEPTLPVLGRSAEIFFKPPTLMAGSLTALWPEYFFRKI